MSDNDLTNENLHSEGVVCEFPATTEPPPPAASRRHRDAVGRFAPSAASTERIAGFRSDLDNASGLPAPWRELLATEAALLLDAGTRYLEQVPTGLTTTKGRLRAPYRDYLAVAERLATVLRILGLDDAAAGGSGKQRPWSKLSRAEQEAAAAAALAEVEANLARRNDGDDAAGES
jgi:hypothetical protein